MTLGYGPDWLRQRAIGRRNRAASMSASFVKDLNQEIVLEGHTGCVNCLEWNRDGTLLASGSDDRNVIIWNPFSGESKVVNTEHRDNIFSVKFIHNFSDSLVATCAGDGHILLTDILSSRSLMSCRKCHIGRLKRLVTHPNQPHLLWAAGEDGYIVQHDIREKHQCNPSGHSNIIIDLRQDSLSTKCLAINPLRDEILAVGTDDVQIRLYDRRRSLNPTARFVPGHLRPGINGTFGTTYLAFNQNGTELLANLHAEQVYLFNTSDPCESFKSFEASIKPLLFDYSQPNGKLKERKNTDHNVERQIQISDFLSDINNKYEEGHISQREYLEKINLTITEIGDTSAELYCQRAAILSKRGWRGDDWQAFRDCCTALAYKPLYYDAITILAELSYKLPHSDMIQGMLSFIELVLKEFDDAKQLEPAAKKIMNHIKFGCESGQGMSLESFYGSDRRQCDSQLLTDVLAKNNSRSQKPSKEFDFTKRFCGHCNMNTDIKEANFFGPNDEFIVAGSDDGAAYIWDKNTTNIVKAMHADAHILNCVQPHPSICMLATSGIEPNVKIWSTCGKTCKDIKTLESRCTQNQDFMSVDPLEAMIMMLYPET